MTRFLMIVSRSPKQFTAVLLLAAAATAAGCVGDSLDDPDPDSTAAGGTANGGSAAGGTANGGTATPEVANTCNPGARPYPGAIAAGRDDDGSLLWYCLAKHTDGTNQPGKWSAKLNACFYAWGGKEWHASTFDDGLNTIGSWGFVTADPGYSHVIANSFDQMGAVMTTCGGVWKYTLDSGSSGRELGSCSTVVFNGDVEHRLSKHQQPGKLYAVVTASSGSLYCNVDYGRKEYVMNPTDATQLEVLLFYPTAGHAGCNMFGVPDLCN